MQVIQELYSDLLYSLFDFLPIPKLENMSEKKPQYYSAMTQYNFAYYHSDQVSENVKCTTVLEIDFFSPIFILNIYYEGQPGCTINDKYISTKSITNFLNKIKEEIIPANINWPYMKDLKEREEYLNVVIGKLARIKESLQKDINMI